ncbi:arsenic resistance N-acetyltransferase ArsN2 [Leptospira sp. WS39.C2]
MEQVIFQSANDDELPVIFQMLRDNHLPFEDITHISIQNFLLAKFETLTIGCIGIEEFKEIALLRSFCVKESYRKLRIGKSMYQMMENSCHKKGITELFLLTTTAESYFTKLGFLVTDRSKTPEFIKNTTQFRLICPDSAICMKKNL